MKELVERRDIYKAGRLTAQPLQELTLGESATGLRQVHLHQKKECLLYVPHSYHINNSAALAVLYQEFQRAA